MIKKQVLSVVALMSSLILVGCANGMPDLENHILESAFSADATVFRTLYSSEVADLNYLVTSSSVDTAVCANVIDALVDYDQYGNIVPGSAESWESNDDMTEWTFHLRDGIVWVDYEGNYYADVVADDWVAAAEYVNNAANETDCQYMYSTGSVVKNALEYYNYTSYLMHPRDYDKAPKSVAAEDIGVKAIDDRTLVYYLEKPCPFFPSVLSYTSYLPICRKYLEDVGNMFAKDNKSMLYNGAYILNYFVPLEKQIFVKNPTYWDAQNVFIDRIENTYDTDSSSVAAKRYLSGGIDKAVINIEKLAEYMADENMSEQIHRSRPDSSFSYFYAFNFVPKFESSYEPENWEKAVVNENFRKAIMASINKEEILAIYEPYEPTSLINNTVTPPGAAAVDGKDYTSFGQLQSLSDMDNYNLSMASEYKNKAKSELEQAGVTFPIKILMPYNPATEGWKHEAYMIEEQIETALGSDFVDIIVEEGSDTGFLLSVRRSGKYALMKCRWGADYADPQTWTEPFEDDGEYMFWHECTDEDIRNIHEQWRNSVDEAAAITADPNARFESFADAESLIINHAIVIPFSIMSGDGYLMSKVDEFEGEYSSYGMARQRYKLLKVHDKSMSMEEFEEKYNEWKIKAL